MRSRYTFTPKSVDAYPDFDIGSEAFVTELADVWLGEVSRSSPEYVRWVQRSLNQILGARLAVDGIIGSQTRSAIRSFQQRRKLRVDGIVGPQTEAALIAAGATPPLGFASTGTATSTGQATLADLASFSRNYIQQIIAAKRKLDCADLVIEVWIRFGEQYGVPVSFRNITRQRNSFASTSDFVLYVQRNVGAVSLGDDTYEVPGGHRAAVTGDVFLWRYFHEVTGRQHRWGHTQILDQVNFDSRGPDTDQITIVQGSLPPIVPEFRTLPATYFYQPRKVNLRMNDHREPHIGRLVGNGPRRFNSFRHLR